MAMMDEQLGLRERKRRATRVAIQRAAISLATERGLDGVTVEEISRDANVSPRTFFNYFSSKDAAIVGEIPQLPGEEAIGRFIAAASPSTLLDDIATLLTESLLADEAVPDAADATDATGDADGAGLRLEADLHERRRALLKDHPQLVALKMASMREFEEHLTGVIERRLAGDDAVLAADPDALHQRARLVTYIAFAGMRHAWSCWADHGGQDSLSARLRDSFRQMQTLSLVGSRSPS